MRTIASMKLTEISSLLSTKANPIDIKQAQQIRARAREYGSNMIGVLRFADDILKTCGLESFRVKVAGVWRWVTYLNAGDTYNTTLLLYRGKIYIGCWGDLAEKYETRPY